ncbi:MAG: tyrosine-type recombinase/integrase, partial [Eggerthellaceae bacterium]|nr:tyrosine-type recombinase/integrase [Eggerthellaceae bacterium]
MSDSSQDSFSQTIDAFLSDMVVERNASPHTIRNYRIDLCDYAQWAERGEVDPFCPTHRQLRRYLAELDQARYSRSTVNRRLSALRTFFRWAMITGRTQENPAEILMSIKQDKHLPHRISPNDMQKILAVNAPRDSQGRLKDRTPSEVRNQAILEFLYASGARISEVSSLRTVSIDYSSGSVRLFGKGSKERIVFVHTLALESMRYYQLNARPVLLEGKSPSDFFFVSTRGNQMGTDSLRKLFKATLEAAGVSGDYTPHDMRHT